MTNSVNVLPSVAIVGAGPAGLVMGLLAMRAGISARVWEATSIGTSAGAADAPMRSINLALSARGLHALDAVGLRREVEALGKPMHGREVHPPGGNASNFQSYDLVGDNSLLSIRRADLLDALLRQASRENLPISFGARCTAVDLQAGRLEFSRGADRAVAEFDLLVGADGVHSAVRDAIAKANGEESGTTRLPHTYLDFTIPASHAYPLRRNALHVWPREQGMLLAFPNTDGTFTATLFMAAELDRPNAAERAGFTTLFCGEFADARRLVPDWRNALQDNPIGRVFTSHCESTNHGDRAIVIGDAAHAMAPFFGQGLNCALEDCHILAQALRQWHRSGPAVVSQFARGRRADCDAITRLSAENYDVMNKQTANRAALERRDVERLLQTAHADLFTPLYSAIAFSTLPYTEAMARETACRPIVDRLLNARPINAADLTEAGELLRNLPRSGVQFGGPPHEVFSVLPR